MTSIELFSLCLWFVIIQMFKFNRFNFSSIWMNFRNATIIDSMGEKWKKKQNETNHIESGYRTMLNKFTQIKWYFIIIISHWKLTEYANGKSEQWTQFIRCSYAPWLAVDVWCAKFFMLFLCGENILGLGGIQYIYVCMYVKMNVCMVNKLGM